MKLLAGNCELPNQEEYGTFTTESLTSKPLSDKFSINSEYNENLNYSNSIFNLGSRFKLEKNKTFEFKESNEIPWQPLLEGNSLDKDSVGESSRSFSSEPSEIFEPVLKDRRLAVNKGRHFFDPENAQRKDEIIEPVLKSTTHRHKKSKEMNRQTTNVKRKAEQQNSATPPEVVQLLPFRLGDLLQRAERYARETLLPLISVQAPRFFGFNAAAMISDKKEETRKPRYIPRFEEEAFLKNTSTNTKTKVTISPKTIKRNFDLVPTKQSIRRNIFAAMRESPSRNSDQKRAFNEITYYTNELTQSRALRPQSPDYEAIHIDLPTFRPNLRQPDKTP